MSDQTENVPSAPVAEANDEESFVTGTAEPDNTPAVTAVVAEDIKSTPPAEIIAEVTAEPVPISISNPAADAAGNNTEKVADSATSGGNTVETNQANVANTAAAVVEVSQQQEIAQLPEQLQNVQQQPGQPQIVQPAQQQSEQSQIGQPDQQQPDQPQPQQPADQQASLQQQPQPQQYNNVGDPEIGQAAQYEDTFLDSKQAAEIDRPDSPSRPETKHGKRVDDEEGLGDNFEDTPWVPPSLSKAVEYRHHTIFKGSEGAFIHTNMCRSAELGNGTVMYFQFMRSMGICMFVMTLLSIPLLFFAFAGSRMPLEDQDSFSFYRFALGNVGYDRQEPGFIEKALCKEQRSYYNFNETCITVAGDNEISLSAVGSVLTFMEVLQVIVFFCTIWHLKRRLKVVVNELGKDVTSVTDFSIMIRNLPKDCTEEELIAHFSNLYPLDKPDWKNRPALNGAVPIEEVENTHDDRYEGTWVAECFMMRKIGKMLNSFLNQEKLTKQIRHARAEAKMYADSTVHAKGPNKKKHTKAMKNVEKFEVKIESLAQSVFNAKKMVVDQKDEEENLTNAERAQRIINKFDPVAAFIIFQYSESMARCVEDYEKYSTFPYNFCYPEKMKFKGQKLRVSQAPEPDQLLFENMEIPAWKKYLSRFVTNAAGFILLMICFIIIVQGSIYKNKFSSQIPNLGFCSDVVPMGYGYSYQNTITNFDSYQLVRPPEGDERKRLDRVCDQYNPGSFYSVMALSVDTYTDTMVSYNFSSCEYTSSSDKNGLCPHAAGEKNGAYCPCVSITSTESCDTYLCDDNDATTLCKQYEAKLVGSCYCFNFLLDMIASEGVGGTMDYIKNAQDDVCYPFFINYSKATAVTYGTTVITVLVNSILKYCLKVLTDYECHADVDKAQASLMFKTFISTFFNMAVVVLIAFGLITGTPEALRKASIFQGVYPDFTSAWYGVVGAYLVLTFAIQVVTAPISDFLNYAFIKPLMRCYVYPKVSSQSSYAVAMQDELNEMEVGPEFDIVTNTAQMVTLIFFCMLYASGLPLLIPIACVTFTAYFMFYKTLILRYYKRPPRVGAGIIETVIGILPYACILRLMFACWMLGNNDVLPPTFPVISGSVSEGSVDGSVGSNTYIDSLGKAKEHLPSNPNSASLVERLSQPNIFPLAVVIAFIIAVKIILFLWPYLPIALIQRVLKWFYKVCCRSTNKVYVDNSGNAVNSVEGYYLLKNDSHGLRQEMAPFTGTYFSYAGNREEIPTSCYDMCANSIATDLNALTEEEVIDGYVTMDQGKYVIKCKQWKHQSTHHGNYRIKGDLKKTFEVIRDVGVPSYHLKNIPRYKLAWHALVEGATNVDDFHKAKRVKAVIKVKPVADTNKVHPYNDIENADAVAVVATATGVDIWQADPAPNEVATGETVAPQVEQKPAANEIEMVPVAAAVPAEPASQPAPEQPAPEQPAPEPPAPQQETKETVESKPEIAEPSAAEPAVVSQLEPQSTAATASEPEPAKPVAEAAVVAEETDMV